MKKPPELRGRKPSKVVPANSVAGRLRALRYTRGLTQEELAAEVGFARGTIAKMESGDDPGGISSLHALARFYNVSLDYIKDGSAALGHDLPAQSVKSGLEESLLFFWNLLEVEQKWAVVNMASVMVTGKPIPTDKDVKVTSDGKSPHTDTSLPLQRNQT